MTTAVELKAERLPYVQRLGKYHYFRLPGAKPDRLPGAEGSPDYLARYWELRNKAEAAAKPQPVAPATEASVEPVYLKGSIGWVIERYLASGQFIDSRKPGTQQTYRYVAALLKRELGGGVFSDIDETAVERYLAKIREECGPARALMQRILISKLWKFAKGLPEVNIAGKPNPVREVARGYRVKAPHARWSPDVQHRFLEGASPTLRLAFYLLKYTGQRRSDVVKMKWSDIAEVRDRLRINVVQKKTGERVPLRLHVELQKLLDQLPRAGQYILTGPNGEPYADDGKALSRAINRRLTAIGVSPRTYTCHGLRKTAACELADLGVDLLDIMAVLGHKTAKQALEYIREARKEMNIDRAFDIWEAAA
jgi:integrase